MQMTPDVYELDARLRGRALDLLSRYNRFDELSEHEHGVFIFGGYSFEWQIEYRNRDGTGFSTDPTDPQCTLRVLTLEVVADILR